MFFLNVKEEGSLKRFANLLSKKGTIDLLMLLKSDKKPQYKDLKKELKLGDKSLSQRIKDLTELDIIRKGVENKEDKAVSVYQLSPNGWAIVTYLIEIQKFFLEGYHKQAQLENVLKKEEKPEITTRGKPIIGNIEDIEDADLIRKAMKKSQTDEMYELMDYFMDMMMYYINRKKLTVDEASKLISLLREFNKTVTPPAKKHILKELLQEIEKNWNTLQNFEGFKEYYSRLKALYKNY